LDSHLSDRKEWFEIYLKDKERLVLPSLSRVILGSLDILVDIGFPAEKEVIQ